MKTAVIVAAGLSSRLYPLTETTPKCLLPLGQQSILQRNLQLLEEHGFEQIIIVTGYLKEMIEQVTKGRATIVFNPYFKYCNNMGSLYAAKSYIQEDSFLYLHGDVVFSETLLTRFLQQINTEHFMDLAVDFKETDEEAMKVQVDADCYLVQSSKEITPENSHGEWIGLAAIHQPAKLFAQIEQVLVDEKLTVYDTYAFTQLAEQGMKLKCLPIEVEPWVEIDFIEDYEKAKDLFA